MGLILASEADNFISWDELKCLATDLNIATRLNLLLVLAACHGAHFAQTLKPFDRSPCWGLAGPLEVVSAGSIAKSFTAFYQEILCSGRGGEAVKKLNQDLGIGVIEYSFTTAEMFFTKCYKEYIIRYCGDEGYGDRAKDLHKEMVKQKIDPLPDVAHIQLDFQKYEKPLFEKYRTDYFMYDLYPENKKRFTVTYGKVMK